LNKFLKPLYRMRFIPLALIIFLIVMMAVPATLMAEPTVNLGTTSSFAVLAHTGITNTGSTTITGDVGVDVGTITNTGTLNIIGAEHIADQVAIDAQTDLVTAYDDANSRASTTLSSTQLGGETLFPGVYDTGGVLEIGPANATLTLDAQGDPNAVFIFKSTATLVTSTDSEVRLINGARFCRVFWVVPSSATLGVDSHFEGHIFALTDIQALSGATVTGQLLARTGEVTLEANTITNRICNTIVPDTTSPDTTSPDETETKTKAPSYGPLTVSQVFVNDDGDFEFIFVSPYKDNNWLTIYDMEGNLVYSENISYSNPRTVVDLPDGMYTVRTYHSEGDILQEFIIGKPDDAAASAGVVDELPFTGFNWLPYEIGAAVLLAVIAILLFSLRKRTYKNFKE
jgi:hypothetical protein